MKDVFKMLLKTDANRLGWIAVIILAIVILKMA